MGEQTVDFLKKFDTSLFPESPRQLITAREISPAADARRRPLVFIEDIKAIRPNALVMLDATTPPKEGSFYLFFPDQIKPYLEDAHARQPTIDSALMLWALGVNMCWQRTQNEQSRQATGRVTTWLQLEHLLLTDEELAESVAPFQVIAPEEIGAKRSARALESWSSFGKHLVARGEREKMATWLCKRMAEADTMSAVALWCKTEESVISFLLRCKKVLLKKVDALPPE